MFTICSPVSSRPNTSGGLRVLLAAIVLTGLPCLAQAAPVYWDGGALTSAWTDAANWSTNVVPAPADDVILDNSYVAGSYSVVLNGLNQKARSLQIGYAGNPNAITLIISGGGAGDNLQLGSAPGADLSIAQGGILHNQSAASSASNRGIEFVNAADTWQMTGNGTYIHDQSAGSAPNIALGHTTFSAGSTFEVRAGLTTTYGGATGLLTTVKSYGHLRLTPATGATLSLSTALNTIDSVLVAGDLTLTNSALRLQLNSTNSGPITMRVAGSISIADAQLMVAAGNAGDLLTVGGDVTVTGSGHVSATSASGRRGTLVIAGSLTGKYAGASNNDYLVFRGGAGASTLAVSAASTLRNVSVQKDLALAASAPVSGASNLFEVASGALLDFNGFQITGSGRFTLHDGATVKITSADGLNGGNVSTGNVVTSGTRTFGTGATYWYVGTSPQITGDAIPASSGPKVIICDNPTTLTLSKDLVVGPGGQLDIRQGTFIETVAYELSGSGTLRMTGGTYRIVRIGTALLPQLDTELAGVNQLSAGTIELVGAGSQSLRGNRSYVNLLFGTSGTKSLASAITLPAHAVTGSVTISGSATFEQGTHAFEGPASITMASGRYQIAASGLQPGLTGTYSLTGGTVEFANNNAPKQNIRSLTYPDVEISGSQVIVEHGDLTIPAGFALTIRNSGALEIGDGRLITGAGAFTVSAGGTLFYGHPQGISLSGPTGAVQVTGLRSFPASASYGFRGSQDQITGNALPTQMVNLYLEKDLSTAVVTLSQGAQVNGTLSLTLGRIALTSEDLTINPIGASMVGGGPEAYIQTANTPTATGELILRVPNTSSYVLFPVGTSRYSPVRLALPPTSSANDFAVRVFEGVFIHGTSGLQAHTDVVNRTWMVQKLNPGSVSATLQVQWNEADELPFFDRSACRLKHYHGSSYDSSQPLTAAAGSDPYTLSRSGLASFSPFIVDDGEAVLPVELTRFEARPTPAGVRLSWATASEHHNQHFAVERATTPRPEAFRPVGQVAGAGTTLEPQRYEWLDPQPPRSPVLYYRLRQVDTDSATHLSEVVAVHWSPSAPALSLYPNPATGYLILELPAEAGSLEVHDGLGRLVLHHPVLAAAVTLDIRHLPPGPYTLTSRTPDGSQVVQKFLKRQE